MGSSYESGDRQRAFRAAGPANKTGQATPVTSAVCDHVRLRPATPTARPTRGQSGTRRARPSGRGFASLTPTARRRATCGPTSAPGDGGGRATARGCLPTPWRPFSTDVVLTAVRLRRAARYAGVV